MAELQSTSYHDVKLRRAIDDDHYALYQVFTASRIDLMTALADLEHSQQEEIMLFQFNAQQKYYKSNYPTICFDIIVRNNYIIGYIYTAQVDDKIELVDIALMPEHRNQGIGQALIMDLLDEGKVLLKCVSLHVQHGNPAYQLYERLGFIEAGEQGIYKRMEWRPPSLTVS